jgi:hypothetical protein
MQSVQTKHPAVMACATYPLQRASDAPVSCTYTVLAAACGMSVALSAAVS